MATTTTPSLSPNPNVAQGHKVLLKIQQIARFRIRGLKDADIANQFNLSQSGFARLVASAEYKEVEEQILANVLSKLDEDLIEDVDSLRRKFAKCIPIATQRLLEIAVQDRDLKASLDAAREIFDRDPRKTFAKDNGGPSDPGSGRPIPDALMKDLKDECDTIAKQS